MKLLRAYLWIRARLARADTVVVIRDGKASVARGRLPGRLLTELSEVAAGCPDADGLILAYRLGSPPRLSFVGAITPSVAQRLRNTWMAQL